MLNLEAAELRAAEAGIELPSDFASAAAGDGLRSVALESYISVLTAGGAAVALLAKLTPIIRNRLLADPRFLFKVGVEVLIDTGCATIAEVRKRGDHFWNEFDFYLSDIVVGVVLDAVLVTLIAPKGVFTATKPVSQTKVCKRREAKS